MRITVVLLLFLIVASGCGQATTMDPDTTPSRNAGWLRSYIVDLPDGRHVVCVASVYNTGSTGISCDWQNAK